MPGAKVPASRRSARIASRPPPTPRQSAEEADRRAVKRTRTRKEARREPTPPPARQGIVFPTEVWKQIFENLYQMVGRQGFLPALGFLSALRGEAERVLYREPCLVKTSSAFSFLDSIEHSPHRANTVRELRLKTPVPEADNYLIAIRTALDLLPCLVSIDLSRKRERVSKKTATHESFSMGNVVDGKTLKALKFLRGDVWPLSKDFVQFLEAHSAQLEEIRVYAGKSNAKGTTPPITLQGIQFPKLRAIACDGAILGQMHLPQNLTHLWITDRFGAGAANDAIKLLGPQLVSLRIAHVLRSGPNGPMFPSDQRYAWDQCPLLKYLEIKDRCAPGVIWMRWAAHGERNVLSGLKGRECQSLVDKRPIGTLPPKLETLVWDPLWTTVWRHDRPDAEHRAAMRNYVSRTLKGFSELKEIVYHFGDEGVFHCYLSEEGDVMQAHADLGHFNGDTWARAEGSGSVSGA